MMLATLPVMVAIGAYVFLGEKSTRIQWAGFLLAIVGVLVMTPVQQSRMNRPQRSSGQLSGILGHLLCRGLCVAGEAPDQSLFSLFLTAMQALWGAAFCGPSFLPV